MVELELQGARDRDTFLLCADFFSPLDPLLSAGQLHPLKPEGGVARRTSGRMGGKRLGASSSWFLSPQSGNSQGDSYARLFGSEA